MSRRRGFLVVAVWAFVIAMFFLASWLAGQQQQRGTGYTASHASWEKQDGRRLVTFPIDHSARPWGDDGGGSAADGLPGPDDGDAVYYRRYAGGGPKPSYEDPTVPGSKVYGRGIGAWGEAMGPQIVPALKRWYEQQSPEHRARWTGEPTVEEVYDVAFSQPRNGSFYRAPVVDPTPTPTPSPSPTPEPSPTPQPTATPSSCTPIEPETCPCRESASGRWLAQQIAAWPRNEDGSLRPGQRPAVAVWRLVLAAGEYLAASGETCACVRPTGQLTLALCGEVTP
jgi:hypothetical protein